MKALRRCSCVWLRVASPSVPVVAVVALKNLAPFLAASPYVQAIDKFRHCYVRYEALLAQLHSEAESGPALAATDPQHATSSSSMALLQSLLGAASAAEVGLGEALPASTAFERSFCHEVERLRQFVRSGLEQLWVALLDGCGQLRGLSEELLQARPSCRHCALPSPDCRRRDCTKHHPACLGKQSVCRQLTADWLAITVACLILHAQAGAAAAGLCGPMGARLTCVRGSFDAVAQEVVLLEVFVRQNASACARLAQVRSCLSSPWRFGVMVQGRAGQGKV